jgi:hypothetical protein
MSMRQVHPAPVPVPVPLPTPIAPTSHPTLPPHATVTSSNNNDTEPTRMAVTVTRGDDTVGIGSEASLPPPVPVPVPVPVGPFMSTSPDHVNTTINHISSIPPPPSSSNTNTVANNNVGVRVHNNDGHVKGKGSEIAMVEMKERIVVPAQGKLSASPRSHAAVIKASPDLPSPLPLPSSPSANVTTIVSIGDHDTNITGATGAAASIEGIGSKPLASTPARSSSSRPPLQRSNKWKRVLSADPNSLYEHDHNHSVYHPYLYTIQE